MRNTDGETKENEKSFTLTNKNINDSPQDSFSVLVERLDTLQNFFQSEISDIKAEIKQHYINVKWWFSIPWKI